MSAALLSAFFIAVGLAMDAFTVSLAGGGTLKKDILKTALAAGALFGLFQFFMPLLGYLVGVPITEIINPYGYWLVLALFLFIGGKMIYDAFSEGDEGVNLTDWKILTVLAVATSIDALAIGVSYAILGEEIFIPAIIIGVVAFFFSAFGVFAGSKLGGVLGNKMQIVGGIILVLIGLKLFLENVVFI